jgi:glycerophosphoryl diester phosphodiesterase
MIGVYMKKALVLMFAAIIAPCVYAAEIISHRGYWNTEGSAQNSISSLTNAHKAGFYGSEMDVYITSDNVVAVNHDAAPWGVSIENNTWDKLLQTRLPNGEDLPTFEKYISAHKELGGDTKLVIEFKQHAKPENDERAIDSTLALVKKYGAEDKVIYVSLSVKICETAARKAPEGTTVLYLLGNLNPKELKKRGITGFSYPVEIVMLNPDWIKSAKKLGLKSGVWTVNDEQKLQWCIDRKVDLITTDNPVLLRDMLEQSSKNK